MLARYARRVQRLERVAHCLLRMVGSSALLPMPPTRLRHSFVLRVVLHASALRSAGTKARARGTLSVAYGWEQLSVCFQCLTRLHHSFVLQVVLHASALRSAGTEARVRGTLCVAHGWEQRSVCFQCLTRLHHNFVLRVRLHASALRSAK